MFNRHFVRDFFYNDYAMLVVVIANALLIFIGGFYKQSILFPIFDALFTVIFVVEAVTKISNSGWNGYWKDNWNRFDFIVLLLALPTLANVFVETSISTNVVLCFRVLRVFKSLRLFRFIPNIEGLISGVKLAFRASFFVSVAFVLFLLILSVFSTALFGDVAPQYFENPAISLYSTFKLFTVEGWYDIPDAIAENSSAGVAIFARIYFSLFLFAGGILGMSLINSIFVDAMVSDNNDEILRKLEKIEKLLEKKDKNNVSSVN
ncbi:MAG: ion transporter [Bacteroidaceae bacterium]|nr:ion transporter [Bacteroidaceae bacterium]